MKHRSILRLAVVGAAVAVFAAAAAPAAAAAGGDPAAAATSYLHARAAAVTAADPAAALAPWTVAGSRLAWEELAVARGTAARAARLGHLLDEVVCTPEVLEVSTGADGLTATVRAHAVVTTTWHNAAGVPSVEGSGVDHVLRLRATAGDWAVVADAYVDVEVPALLEAAGVPAPAVRVAARRLDAAQAVPLPAPRAGLKWTRPATRYRDVIEYDREACRAYADQYALSYNPTWVRFSGADCVNFASQCGRAGHMPMSFGSYDSGWWYDKNGTGNPSDDTYSASWINVPRQMGFWNTRRTDWVTSISSVGKGDFVYYDWTGDGTWDHVAILVGTNSAGQKVIDAHTTDHYRVWWKLGSSSTRYRFARARASWVV